MKTNHLKYLLLLFSGVFLLAGCSQFPDSGLSVPGTRNELTVRLEPEGQTSGRASLRSNGGIDDSAIERVVGYHFNQGIFRGALPGERLGTDETYTFYPRELSGVIYFVANDFSELFGALEPGISSLNEFQKISASTAMMVTERLMMTGQMELSAQQSTPTIRLKRTAARIDISSEERGVTVQRVTIRGIADRGYVIEPSSPSTPNDAIRTDFKQEYSPESLENRSETLLYLCEQSGDPLTAEVIASFGGGEHRMVATFPNPILRNRIYTLRIHGEGADATITVASDGWEEGSSTDALPGLKGLVDVEASTLPEGIRVSASQDSVYVAYTENAFRLVLRAEANSEVEIEGMVRGVTAQIEPIKRTLQPVTSVAITNQRRMPDEKGGYLYLNVRQNEIHSARIVVVFEPSPIHFSGSIKLDENGLCDFGKYVDGELGRISIPEEKIIRLAFDTGEDPWMTLVEENGHWRILGGWKPNDPSANGREQEGRLVISNRDGSDPESYSIRRRNWGLPVVEIGGTWWCKYNLRGNVKEFGDQIPIQSDPAISTELADYLTTCDDTELLRLMGDQYQAGNQQGLPLRHDGSVFYHEGMRSSGQNFGTLDPTFMAPDGYRIPDYDDYAFFSASNNYNLGGVGSRTYQNRNGEEISVRIIERNATLLGQPYGTVSFYEFRSGTGCWVLYGLGHQWDTTPGNIARMMLLLATYGNSASSWMMEGYAQADRPGQNWLKFAGQNSTKTRLIRCVKTPVEYMYE